jgi:hypothetical protein
MPGADEEYAGGGASASRSKAGLSRPDRGHAPGVPGAPPLARAEGAFAKAQGLFKVFGQNMQQAGEGAHVLWGRVPRRLRAGRQAWARASPLDRLAKL